MSEYLLPINNQLTITEKFAIENRMVNISYNFPKVIHKQSAKQNVQYLITKKGT